MTVLNSYSSNFAIINLNASHLSMSIPYILYHIHIYFIKIGYRDDGGMEEWVEKLWNVGETPFTFFTIIVCRRGSAWLLHKNVIGSMNGIYLRVLTAYFNNEVLQCRDKLCKYVTWLWCHFKSIFYAVGFFFVCVL